MKSNIRRTFTVIAIALTVLAVGATLAVAQTNLNFNNVSANIEGAIRLSWNSTSNDIYEIDYADALVDTNIGSLTWKVLYEQYPSHGTNTFWLDTGEYYSDPVIPHPSQTPMRFYRIALTGTNEAPTPTVFIASVTNGSLVSGNLTVIVAGSTDQPIIDTKLYVDGQEMNDADATTKFSTNGIYYVEDTYMINTCEWPNGPHTLFATARCQSAPSGVHDEPDILIGYGVSPYIAPVFSNLITRISFSEPFFTPDDGQTQRVSAVFAANVDWTLEIQDANTNTVRTVTGSGTSMSFGWDGKDDGSSDLPVGNYTYLFTSQTNGQAFAMMSSGGSASKSAPALSAMSKEAAELWALPSESVNPPVPLMLYPPDFDTNRFLIFEATQSEVQALTKAVLEMDAPMTTASFGEEAGESGGEAASSYGGAPSQSTRAPLRPPTNPVRGRAGRFGIAYQTYNAIGFGFNLQGPPNGLPLNQRVQLEGVSGNTVFNFKSIVHYHWEGGNCEAHEEIKLGIRISPHE